GGVVLLVVWGGAAAGSDAPLGFSRPRGGPALVFTPFAGDGPALGRVVPRLTHDGHLYVAANHWPRAWYRRALQNPHVQATLDGKTGDFTAVPVTRAEHDRIDGANRLPPFFRFLTGVPPRYLVPLAPPRGPPHLRPPRDA